MKFFLACVAATAAIRQTSLKSKNQKMVKTSVINKKLTQSRAAAAVPMPVAGKRYSKQQALAIARAHPKLVKVSDDMMDGECHEVAGAATDADAALYGFANVTAWCDDHDFYSCENDALDACSWAEPTCLEVAGVADSSQSMMYGFETVADWCADHDVFSCENDMLEACTWAVPGATVANETYTEDYYATDDYYESYSYDSYSYYDYYDDYYYDSYSYESYSYYDDDDYYDDYGYESYSYYDGEYSDEIAGFELDFDSYGVWCDFVHRYDGWDDTYNLECHPWEEEYSYSYDSYSYGSESYYSSSYPAGTVLCPGNDSSAYCDLEGDCYAHTNDYCWCIEAVDGCIANGYGMA